MKYTYKEYKALESKIEAERFAAEYNRAAILPYLELIAFIVQVARDLLFKNNPETNEMEFEKVKWFQFKRLFKMAMALIRIVKMALKLI